MKSLTIKTTVIIATLFIFSSDQILAQYKKLKDNDLMQNSIYGNVGCGGYYITATAYFERIMARNKDVSLFTKAGFGAYDALFVKGGQYIHTQFGILTGHGTHHIELAIGPNWFLNGGLKGKLPIGGGFGYRLQKPGSHFLFRAGVAAPEAIYLGIGVPF